MTMKSPDIDHILIFRELTLTFRLQKEPGTDRKLIRVAEERYFL